MKKNKLKNYLKLGIFLFGISLLLINCVKEEIIEEVQQQKKVTRISFSDFKQNVN